MYKLFKYFFIFFSPDGDLLVLKHVVILKTSVFLYKKKYRYASVIS
jgi:hypothetical protein